MEIQFLEMDAVQHARSSQDIYAVANLLYVCC